MNTDGLRLCKDCKHFAGELAAVQCPHPLNPTAIDYVMGNHRREWTSAAALRSLADMCGPSGKWFEQKAAEPAAAEATS